MAKKKDSSWKKGFAELVSNSWTYIKMQKKYIYIIIAVFFASSIFGYINSSELSFLDKSLIEIGMKTEGLDALELLWFIFSNNVTSAVTSLFLGAILGIFPLFNALFNGTILGYVYSKAVPIAGYLVIWRLLPHGIFELPAIFISLGLGLHLGMSFFAREGIKTFKTRFNNSLKAFLSIVVPLLMIAAIIESFLIHFLS